MVRVKGFLALPIAESVVVVAAVTATPFGAVHPLDVPLVSLWVALVGRIPRINAKWEVEGLQTLFVAPACGVSVSVHVYKIAQNWQNARDFFAILQIIFVDGFSNERFILQVGTALA